MKNSQITLHPQNDFLARFLLREYFNAYLYQTFSYIINTPLFFFEVFTTLSFLFFNSNHISKMVLTFLLQIFSNIFELYS